MPEFRIRGAQNADAAFLGEMLYEASNWNGRNLPSRAAMFDDPKLMRYVSGWKRPQDDGVVALDHNDVPIGACWFRVLPKTEAGYGYVAAGVPEITLGVRPIWRAKGIGRALLRSTVVLAAGRGHQRLSLSVERANHAQRLYVSEGFVTVESGVDSDTMVRALR